MRVKETGHFLHVQNHDLLKFIIRQWYTFNKNFEYQNEERHLIYSLSYKHIIGAKNTEW